MARMKFIVNVTSLLPSNQSASAKVRGIGVGATTSCESVGRFGWGLIQLSTSNNSVCYEIKSSSIRGSSFRFSCAGEVEMPESTILHRLESYIIRLKINAHSNTIGTVWFDVRERGGNSIYNKVKIRNVVLRCTEGAYVEFLGQVRRNNRLIDLRRSDPNRGDFPNSFRY